MGAILAAVEVLRRGDILLLECSQRSKLPLQVMEHYHAAILTQEMHVAEFPD